MYYYVITFYKLILKKKSKINHFNEKYNFIFMNCNINLI